MDAAEAIHEKFVAKVRGGKLPRRTSDVQPVDVGCVMVSTLAVTTPMLFVVPIAVAHSPTVS